MALPDVLQAPPLVGVLLSVSVLPTHIEDPPPVIVTAGFTVITLLTEQVLPMV
jgi:hypothetical protein